MAETYHKFESFVGVLGVGGHDLNSDTIKAILLDTTPIAADENYASVSGDEIATGNGYTQKDKTIANSAYSEAAGVGTFSGDNAVWTATGAVPTFQWVVLLNETAANDELICWWERAAGGVTLANGETFTLDISSDILTIE